MGSPGDFDRRGVMDWYNTADTLKALGHPVRLQIVAILCETDENVGNLAHTIGASPSAISQQLSILRMRGLVSRQYNDGYAIYTLEEPRLRDLIACMSRCGKHLDGVQENNRAVQATETPLAANGEGGNA